MNATPVAAKPAPPPPRRPSPSLWFHEELTPFNSYHHGVDRLVHTSVTPFQSMTIADIGPYGRALFLDGKIQTASGDEAHYHEPLVHTPALLHASPARFLVLGGADGGAVREALRWPGTTHVTLVDIDGEVLAACQEHLGAIHAGALQDERVTVVTADAADFIRDCDAVFDVVVCDLTDPMEASPSIGLFTVDFFTDLKRLLAGPEATLSVQAGPSSLVENPDLFPRVCATLRAAFGTVLPFQIFAPSYGSPLGMAVASDAPVEVLAEDVADIRLGELKGECRVLDGASWRSLFGISRETRARVESERRIYSRKEMAAAFGRGSLET